MFVDSKVVITTLSTLKCIIYFSLSDVLIKVKFVFVCL